MKRFALFNINSIFLLWMPLILFFSSYTSAATEVKLFAKPRTVEFKVKDLVTQLPVKDVKVHLFPSYCHSTGVFYKDYDYLTCNGVYDQLPEGISNQKGIVSFKLTARHPRDIRLRIEVPESYQYTVVGTYDLSFLEKGEIIWLIEQGNSGLKIPTSNKAIQYLTEQPIIKIMEAFYTPRNIRLDILKLALEYLI